MTERFPELPLGCILRAARADDIWAIRFLVLGAIELLNRAKPKVFKLISWVSFLNPTYN